VANALVPEYRANGSEKLNLPNGGADQGLIHMDSSIGELWQNLAGDGRVPNSTLNEVNKIGDDLGRGKIDVPTARALIRGIKTDSPAVRDRINKAVAELEVKPSKVDVPDNVPAEVRSILNNLNEIPAYHNKSPNTRGTQGPTPFEEILKLVRDISNGDEGPGGDMKLVHAMQNPHESGDGVYQARRDASKLFPGPGQSPAVRDWFRSWRKKEQAPSTPEPAKATPAPAKAAKKATKAAPTVTKAELRSPVAKVGAEAPKAAEANVTAKGLTPGEGVPVSTFLALQNRLGSGKNQDLRTMDRYARVPGDYSKVPDLYRKILQQLQQAGVGPDDPVRKAFEKWFTDHFS
jgi:hypothetical protein